MHNIQGKNSKYFAKNVCLFTLTQKGQTMSIAPLTSPLVRKKNLKLDNSPPPTTSDERDNLNIGILK